MLTFEVFFDEKYLANILSFASVGSKFAVTLNKQLDPSINVHLHNGTMIIFKQCGGVYIVLTQPTKPFLKTKPQTTPFSTL